MTTPKFHSSALRASFEANSRIIENHTTRLDQMSSDIKALEAYLEQQSVRVGVDFPGIELEPCRTAFLYWCIDQKSSRWRIMCQVNTEAGEHSSWEIKPLIETPAKVRIAVYNYLPDFLKQIANQMRVDALEKNVDPIDGREYELDDSCKDVKF